MSNNDWALICGGDSARPETPTKKSILNTSHEKHKHDKSVTIIEPETYLCEKKIKEIRLRVDELIKSQIRQRRDEFDDLKASVLPSPSKRFFRIFLKLFLLFLILTMIKASICHSQNCYCEVFWYESILAGVFGIFTSTYKDDFPT